MDTTRLPFTLAIAGDSNHPRIELYGPYGDSANDHAEVFAQNVVFVAKSLGLDNIKAVVEIIGPKADYIMEALSAHSIRFATNAEELAELQSA